MNENISKVSGVLYAIGFIPYIVAIYWDRKLLLGTRGKAEPQKVTWFIWALLDTLTLIGKYLENTDTPQIYVAAFGGWVVFCLSLRYGKPGWSKTDKICLVGAIVGIVLMAVRPEYGLLASLLCTIIASFPTFESAWKDPGAENKLGWTIFAISCVLSLSVIPERTIAGAGQEVTFMIIQGTMVFLVYRKVKK